MATRPADKGKNEKPDRKEKPVAKAADKGAKGVRVEARPVSGATRRPVSGAAARPASAATARPPSQPAVRRPSSEPGVRIAAKAKDDGKGKAAAKPALRSPFSAEELGKWRQFLITKRFEITEDITALEKDAMEAEDGHTTPQHTAERGSDADIQDVSLSLAGQEKELLWQIDRAIRKIDSSDPIPFGLCEYTKTPISKGRLENMPWTPLSIEGATYLEREGLTLEDLLVEG